MTPVLVNHGILPFERSRERGLMHAYSTRVPLVYVDPDPERRRTSSLADATAAVARGDRLVAIKMPRSLPGGRFRAVGLAARWLSLRTTLAQLKARTGREVVLINQQPGLLPTTRGLPADLTVYYVTDDYAALIADPVSARRVQRAHDRLIRECDLVLAISDVLVEDIRKVRSDVARVPVGIEYDEFARGALAPAPAAVSGIARPRIGSVGSLNERIDWELLVKLCEARPEWQVVLVGPLYHAGTAALKGYERLRQLPNAHVLPPVPHSEMAAVMASFDVGLIPYRITPALMRINPYKMYQYLAVGLPVVSTPIPAVSEFADVVAQCSTVEECVRCVERALAEPSSRREERRRRARALDWQVVADYQLELMTDRLKSRAGRSRPHR